MLLSKASFTTSLHKASKLLYRIVALLSLLSLSTEVVRSQDTITSLPFQPGEKLRFALYVGPLHVGDAHLQVRKKMVQCHSKKCLHIRAYGRTIGWWRKLKAVDNIWGSYYLAESHQTSFFYRLIQENNYRKYETTTFYLQKAKAVVRSYKDKKMKKLKEKNSYDILPQTQDMISGYYYLRTLPFEDYLTGYIIQIPVFFEDTFYEMKIRYLGTEYIETELGKIKAYILSPIMPENKLFSGKNAIKVWLSSDKNRVPLRVEAKMFLGSVRVELTSAKNLPYPLQRK